MSEVVAEEEQSTVIQWATPELITTVEEELDDLQEAILLDVIYETKAEEALEDMVHEAEEEHRIGSELALNLRNVNYMRIVGMEMELFNLEEEREHYQDTDEPSFMEQTLIKQYGVTLAQQQQVEVQRETTRQQLENDLAIQELEEVPRTLALTNFQSMCQLEADLMSKYPDQFPVVLQQLVDLCSAKAWGIQSIHGYETLQKMMLQFYVPYYSAFPFSLNMFAMQLTAASAISMEHLACTLYAMGAAQAYMLKTKMELQTVELRALEAKIVSSGKSSTDAVPMKISLDATEDLDLDEKITIQEDNTGHKWLWMALRYAYSMPYWLRRMIAIRTGMPENYKYGLYFGIGGLPSRHSTWKQKWLHAREAAYLNYSTDQNVMDMIKKYQAKKGYFYTRYGQYYNKERR